MTNRKPDARGDYVVGYGRPPKGTQFKPGESGNLKGRPKGSRSLDTLFAEELAKPVILIEDGRRKKMTKREAFVRQVVNKGLNNDSKARSTLLEQMRRCDSLPSPAPQSRMLPVEFEAIVKKLLDEY